MLEEFNQNQNFQDYQAFFVKKVIDSELLVNRYESIKKILAYDLQNNKNKKAKFWQILFFIREALNKQRFILKYSDKHGLLIQIIPKHGGPSYNVLVLHQAQFFQSYIIKFMSKYKEHLKSQQEAVNQIIESIKLIIQNTIFKFQTQRGKMCQHQPNMLLKLEPVAAWICDLTETGYDHRQIKDGLTGLAIYVINMLLILHMANDKNISYFIRKKQTQTKSDSDLPQQIKKGFDRVQNERTYINKIYQTLKKIIGPQIRSNMSSEQIYNQQIKKLSQIDKYKQLDSWQIHKKTNIMFKDNSYHISKYLSKENQKKDYKLELEEQLKKQQPIKEALKKQKRKQRDKAKKAQSKSKLPQKEKKIKKQKLPSNNKKKCKGQPTKLFLNTQLKGQPQHIIAKWPYPTQNKKDMTIQQSEKSLTNQLFQHSSHTSANQFSMGQSDFQQQNSSLSVQQVETDSKKKYPWFGDESYIDSSVRLGNMHQSQSNTQPRQYSHSQAQTPCFLQTIEDRPLRLEYFNFKSEKVLTNIQKDQQFMNQILVQEPRNDP